MMKRKFKLIIKSLLFLGSILCAILFVLFIKNEEKLAVKRQEQVNELAVKLQPVNEERKKWQDEDKAWKDSMDKKIKGESCMLIAVDNIERNLYDTIFTMMAQYGFKATFTLKDGQLPESPDTEDKDRTYINTEQFQEMLDAGWEYAVSVTEPEITEAEQNNWIEQVDAVIGRLNEGKIGLTSVIFTTASQYSAENDPELISRGFREVSILNKEKASVITDSEEDFLHIDSCFLNQNNMDIEQTMDKAASGRQSMAVTVNEVLRISKDGDTDVSLTKFTSFFNKLKGMEEQGLFQIMTYSEYYDYQKQLEINKEKLLAEYKEFKQEMKVKMAELDQQEQEIVKKAEDI